MFHNRSPGRILFVHVGKALWVVVGLGLAVIWILAGWRNPPAALPPSIVNVPAQPVDIQPPPGSSPSPGSADWGYAPERRGDDQEACATLPLDSEWVKPYKAIMVDTNAGRELQAYAAGKLVRAGTADAMQAVLDEYIAACLAGDEARAGRMAAALEAPTTAEGLQILFDLLLRRGAYADVTGERPPEVLAAARKALIAAPDRQAVGDLAEKLFFEPDVIANEAATWELFEGVGHPVMLSRLAAHAYAEYSPEIAALFLDRLGRSDEQGVVQAIVELALNPSVPLDAAAGTLYAWSLAHPAEAKPGLFLDYMTDSSLTPAQRTLAAYGLAGTPDPEYAKQALGKALNHETDPAVRLNLKTAMSLLTPALGVANK
jgi:hypothetical protein